MIAVCALAALIPGLARSDETFRCGSYLVSMPLSVAELLQKCGQPSSKKASTDEVRARVSGGGSQKIGTSATEVWRYDRPGSPPMLVTIVDGVIQSMEAGQK
jgi:hypothetical protein